MSYIIVKYVKHYETELPVILIDEFGEVLTFDGENDAEDYKNLFQTNSDSGHRYEIKHVSEKI